MRSREPFSEIIFSVALLLFTEIRGSSWDQLFFRCFQGCKGVVVPRSERLRHSIIFDLRTKTAQLCAGEQAAPFALPRRPPRQRSAKRPSRFSCRRAYCARWSRVSHGIFTGRNSRALDFPFS